MKRYKNITEIKKDLKRRCVTVMGRHNNRIMYLDGLTSNSRRIFAHPRDRFVLIRPQGELPEGNSWRFDDAEEPIFICAEKDQVPSSLDGRYMIREATEEERQMLDGEIERHKDIGRPVLWREDIECLTGQYVTLTATEFATRYTFMLESTSEDNPGHGDYSTMEANGKYGIITTDDGGPCSTNDIACFHIRRALYPNVNGNMTLTTLTPVFIRPATQEERDAAMTMNRWNRFKGRQWDKR